MSLSNWVRYRFHSSSVEDYRPITFPPAGPYWCSGHGDDYAVLIAYLPPSVDLLTFWPEATDIDAEPRSEIVFTSRFARPSWWKGEGRDA